MYPYTLGSITCVEVPLQKKSDCAVGGILNVRLQIAVGSLGDHQARSEVYSINAHYPSCTPLDSTGRKRFLAASDMCSSASPSRADKGIVL